MSKNTTSVLLEYCGGTFSDALYEQLRRDNPQEVIYVLDNASPRDRCRYITHQNSENSFIGGGIRDCIQIAKKCNAKYLFFIANDLMIETPLDLAFFEQLLESDENIIMAGASLSPSSDKARYYPWMVHQAEGNYRLVKHCDLLLCLLRLDFIDSFGGFPESLSGYGYDFEMAYQAKIQQKKIAVIDRFICQHRFSSNKSKLAFPTSFNKNAEMKEIYNLRYGDWRMIHPLLW